MIYRLIKRGYGTYEELINTPIDVIMDMLNYETFSEKYEEIYYKKLEQKNKK